MKKIEIGQALSTLANLGVLAGIIFLAIEVRQSRTATEIQTIQDLTSGWFALNEAVVSDSDVARTWIVGLYKPESLSTIEAAQFSMHMRMFQNQVVRVRQHRDLGLASEEDYQFALQQFATLLDTPGGQRFLNTTPESNRGGIFSELQPYLGRDPVINLMLDRDVSSLE